MNLLIFDTVLTHLMEVVALSFVEPVFSTVFTVDIFGARRILGREGGINMAAFGTLTFLPSHTKLF